MVSRKGQVRPGPEGGKRDTNRRERIQLLRETGLSLFLERGIDGVTIDDITQTAGVAKGTYYRYFDDKVALVESLVGPVRDEFVGALKKCSRDLRAARDVPAMFEAYKLIGAVLASLVLGHAGVLRLYLQENRGAATGARAPLVELAQEISRWAVIITQNAHTHGLLKPIHPAVSGLAVVGAVERLLLAVLREEDVGNPLEIPEALTSIVLDGLRKES